MRGSTAYYLQLRNQHESVIEVSWPSISKKSNFTLRRHWRPQVTTSAMVLDDTGDEDVEDDAFVGNGGTR
jgi:hypothetical protein